MDVQILTEFSVRDAQLLEDIIILRQEYSNSRYFLWRIFTPPKHAASSNQKE